MKAVAVFPREKQVRLVDHPEPSIRNPTQVKLRMLEVGICGTDREICAFEYGTPPPGSDYLVLGHESLAEVVEVGSEVAALGPGDLAVAMVRRPCPHRQCPACRAERQDFCVTGDYTERGIFRAHGYMTEFVVEDERYVVPVAPELREVGILVEPTTVVAKALEEVWQVQQRLPWISGTTPGAGVGRGRNAVVLGAGPVGLLGAMGLRAHGFETFVYSRSPAPNPKAALVESIGARYVSSETHSVDELAERAGPVAVILEAVGASKVAFDTLRVLGNNGVFVFTGVPGRKAPIELDADLLMRNLVLKNQAVLGSVNAGRGSFETAIRALAEFDRLWPSALRALVTGRFPVEGCADLLLGRATGMKNVISFA
jgi:threonine dehydrogenase-like Zn-dependent dehydrogenase